MVGASAPYSTQFIILLIECDCDEFIVDSIMIVFVNKKAVEVSEGASLHSLVGQLEMLDKPIAVAIGTQIITRDQWLYTDLMANSQISMISICKGG